MYAMSVNEITKLAV